jgi:hypothetical protein
LFNIGKSGAVTGGAFYFEQRIFSLKAYPFGSRTPTPVLERAPCQAPLRLPCSEIWLVSPEWSEGSAMVSTFKAPTQEISLIEKIKAEIKKRAETKTKRMLLKRSKRLAKRSR